MIRWQEPCEEAADAVRMYGEMWSVERIADLFGSDYEAMRRLLARRTKLRPTDTGKAK